MNVHTSVHLVYVMHEEVEYSLAQYVVDCLYLEKHVCANSGVHLRVHLLVYCDG